jgi:hypothetical protein
MTARTITAVVVKAAMMPRPAAVGAESLLERYERETAPSDRVLAGERRQDDVPSRSRNATIHVRTIKGAQIGSSPGNVARPRPIAIIEFTDKTNR